MHTLYTATFATQKKAARSLSALEENNIQFSINQPPPPTHPLHSQQNASKKEFLCVCMHKRWL